MTEVGVERTDCVEPVAGVAGVGLETSNREDQDTVASSTCFPLLTSGIGLQWSSTLVPSRGRCANSVSLDWPRKRAHTEGQKKARKRLRLGTRDSGHVPLRCMLNAGCCLGGARPRSDCSLLAIYNYQLGMEQFQYGCSRLEASPSSRKAPFLPGRDPSECDAREAGVAGWRMRRSARGSRRRGKRQMKTPGW